MSKEDELVQAVMGRSTEDFYPDNYRFSPEEHYNYYGDRGVVDLVEETWEEPKFRGNCSLWVYEIKSEYAVENATGANEIIRQFKRHRDYFFQGSDYDQGDYFEIDFGLMFYATEETYDHLRANEEIYRTLLEDGHDSTKAYTTTNTHVVLYHPDAEGYAHPFNDVWGRGVNSRSILKIIGREDELVEHGGGGGVVADD